MFSVLKRFSGNQAGLSRICRRQLPFSESPGLHVTRIYLDLHKPPLNIDLTTSIAGFLTQFNHKINSFPYLFARGPRRPRHRR